MSVMLINQHGDIEGDYEDVISMKDLIKEFETAKHGNYEFHKYTDEYGYVITVEDVLATLEKYT